MTIPQRRHCTRILAGHRFARINKQAIYRRITTLGQLTREGAQRLISANILIETNMFNRIMSISAYFTQMRLIFIGFSGSAKNVRMLGNATALDSHDCAKIGNGDAFRANACRQLVDTRNQGHLALRIHARRHAINIVIFRRQSRKHASKGRLLNKGIRMIGLITTRRTKFTFAATNRRVFCRITIIVRIKIHLDSGRITFFGDERMIGFVYCCTVGRTAVQHLGRTVFIDLHMRKRKISRASIQAFQHFS